MERNSSRSLATTAASPGRPPSWDSSGGLRDGAALSKTPNWGILASEPQPVGGESRKKPSRTIKDIAVMVEVRQPSLATGMGWIRRGRACSAFGALDARRNAVDLQERALSPTA